MSRISTFLVRFTKTSFTTKSQQKQCSTSTAMITGTSNSTMIEQATSSTPLNPLVVAVPKKTLQPSQSHSTVAETSLNFSLSPLNKLLSPSQSQSRTVVTSPKMVDVSSAQIQEPKLLQKETFHEFNAVFPELMKYLTEIPEMRDMPETNRWLARVLQFNVPHGKRNRGLSTALAYRYFADELHDENLKLSYILGWTIEILQAFFLVADDVMDNSETRRGRPCWYKVDNMGAAAFNDSLLLEGSIYPILKNYFRGKDYYVDLLEIMHDATYKTIYGQSLDTRTGLGRKMETYTMDRYNGIVKYKTSFYSFHLPVALAMAMAGVKDSDLKRQVEKVTLEIGHFFQVQDDYLDCFGDIEVTGKIGTDIQDCKCSWLFVKALEQATPEQRQLLLANYGQDETEKIALVKQIYIEMGLPQLYQRFEEETFCLISNHIQQMSQALPKRLFHEMLAKIYQRSS